MRGLGLSIVGLQADNNTMMAYTVPEMAYRRAGLDRPRDVSNIEFNGYGLMGHYFKWL